MKKKILSLLLLVALVVTAMPLIALPSLAAAANPVLEDYNALYVQEGYQYGIDFFPLNEHWEGAFDATDYPAYADDSAAWSTLEKAWLDQFAFHAEGNETRLYSNGKKAQNYTVGAGFLTLATGDDLVLMFEGFPDAPRATESATAAVSHQMLIKHNTTLNNWAFAFSGVTLPFKHDGTQFVFGDAYHTHKGGNGVPDGGIGMEPLVGGYYSYAPLKAPFELTTVMTDTMNDDACEWRDKTTIATHDTIANYTPQDGRISYYGVFGAGGLPFDNAKMVIGKWTNGTSTRGMDSHLYAYRYYDRALTEAEMKQNHLADLIKWFHIDLDIIGLLSKNEFLALSNDPALVAAGFETETVGDTDLNPAEYIEAKVAEIVEIAAYNSLYVQDGYQYGIDFFVLNENWESFVPTTYPVYDANTITRDAWSALEKAWLEQFAFHAEGNTTHMYSNSKAASGYTVGAGFLTISQGDDLGLVFENLPAVPTATADAEVSITHQLLLKHNTLLNQHSIALSGILLPFSSDGTQYTFNDSYKIHNGGHTVADGGLSMDKITCAYAVNASMKVPFELTSVMTDTVNDAACDYRDKTTLATHDTIKNYTPQDGMLTDYGAFAEGGIPFDNSKTVIGKWLNGTSARGMDAHVYAYRYYDRALTVDEMKQNHLADLAKWFRVDIDFMTALSDETFLALASDEKVLAMGFETETVEGTSMTPAEYIIAKGTELRRAEYADVMSFAGYQVRVDAEHPDANYAGVRAVFDVDEAMIADILAAEEELALSVIIKAGGEAKTKLTIHFTYGSGGVIRATGYMTDLSTGEVESFDDARLYERGNGTDAVTSFAYTVVYKGADATKAKLEAEFSYAYEVATGTDLLEETPSYTMQKTVDVTSTTFGDTVSAEELYTYFGALTEYAEDCVVNEVLDLCAEQG